MYNVSRILSLFYDHSLKPAWNHNLPVVPYMWTNNNTESTKYVLKQATEATQWRLKQLPQIIDTVSGFGSLQTSQQLKGGCCWINSYHCEGPQ